MADKLIIHKISPYVDYKYWLKRLNTPFNEPTNQDSISAPKVFKPTNKKSLDKTLGTSVIPPPPSLGVRSILSDINFFSLTKMIIVVPKVGLY